MHRLEDLVQIGEAAKIRGVSIDTLRRWEKSGKLKSEKTEGLTDRNAPLSTSVGRAMPTNLIIRVSNDGGQCPPDKIRNHQRACKM